MKALRTVALAGVALLMAQSALTAVAQDVPNTNRVEIVLGVGADLAGIQAAVDTLWKPNHPGVEVVWSDGKLEDTITTRVRAGDYPDITMLYQIGMLNDFLDAGVPVVAMDDMGLAESLRTAFDERLLDGLGRDGKLYAAPWTHFLNSVIFYNRKFMTDNNLAVPATYDELVALTDQITALGQKAWCTPEVDGSTSGWLGYDWVMDLVLAENGIEFVKDWNAGVIKNTDPRVKAAWEKAGQIRLNWDVVYGGKDATLGTTVFEGATGISKDPPTCVLFKGESWANGIIGLDDPKTGLNTTGPVGMFPFPKTSADAPASATVNGNYLAVFKDSVEARSLVEFLFSEDFYREFSKVNSNWLSANKTFDAAQFQEGNEYYAQITAMLKETPVTTSEAPADAVPLAQAKAMWSGWMDYLKSDGQDLDAILARIDAARP
jgi:alpha-glucoside transport system substrate-binding protein